MNGINYTFTWFGPGNKKSKFDRIIVNDLWLKSSSRKAIGWNRRKSDHLPITVQSDGIDWGLKPFRVFYDWLKEEEVHIIMRNRAKNFSGSSWSGLIKNIGKK